jgi:inosine-uridine nucleoside N-ribohydrolase
MATTAAPADINVAMVLLAILAYASASAASISAETLASTSRLTKTTVHVVATSAVWDICAVADHVSAIILSSQNAAVSALKSSRTITAAHVGMLWVSFSLFLKQQISNAISSAHLRRNASQALVKTSALFLHHQLL